MCIHYIWLMLQLLKKTVPLAFTSSCTVTGTSMPCLIVFFFKELYHACLCHSLLGWQHQICKRSSISSPSPPLFINVSLRDKEQLEYRKLSTECDIEWQWISESLISYTEPCPSWRCSTMTKAHGKLQTCHGGERGRERKERQRKTGGRSRLVHILCIQHSSCSMCISCHPHECCTVRERNSLACKATLINGCAPDSLYIAPLHSMPVQYWPAHFQI